MQKHAKSMARFGIRTRVLKHGSARVDHGFVTGKSRVGLNLGFAPNPGFGEVNHGLAWVNHGLITGRTGV